MSLERLLSGEVSLPSLAAIVAERERRSSGADGLPAPSDFRSWAEHACLPDLDALAADCASRGGNVVDEALMRRCWRHAMIVQRLGLRGSTVCYRQQVEGWRSRGDCGCLAPAIADATEAEEELGRATVLARRFARRRHRVWIRETRPERRRKARADRRRARRRRRMVGAGASRRPSSLLAAHDIVRRSSPLTGKPAAAPAEPVPAPEVVEEQDEQEEEQEQPKVQPPRRRSRRARVPLSDAEVAEFNLRLGYHAAPLSHMDADGRVWWEA